MDRQGALDGQVALVTGGARRLGRAIAEELAAEGARVLVHYRSSEAEALALVAEVEAAGGWARAVQGELGGPGPSDRLISAAVAAAGRIDILVNNASTFRPTPLAELREADWDDFHLTNLKAPFFLSLAAARAMPGEGAIVNLTDASVATPWPDYVPYQASKAGLEALTGYLARALAPRVRVNAVAPGPILMPEGAGETERARAIARVPLGRLGEPRDVARAVVLLARPGYATGTVIALDGGRRLG